MRIERRGLAIALVLSLLGNALAAGAFGGFVLGRGKGDFARERSLVSRSGVRTLSAEDRQIFTRAMAPHREATQKAWREHRNARRQAEADIAAPTFDRPKLEADFASLRKAAADAQESNHTGLLDALSGLSATARAALVVRRPAKG